MKRILLLLAFFMLSCLYTVEHETRAYDEIYVLGNYICTGHKISDHVTYYRARYNNKISKTMLDMGDAMNSIHQFKIYGPK